MSEPLTLGIKIDGSGSLPEMARTSRDELAALKIATDNLASSAAKMASGYSGIEEAMKAQNYTLTETSGSVNRLLDRYDPLSAKLRQLEADFKALDNAAKSGSIADKDLGKVDSAYAKIQQEIKATTEAANNFGSMASGAANKTAFATQRAQQEFMVLGRELMSGNTSRIPSTLSIIAQGLSPVALATAGVTAAVAAGAYAWTKWGDEAESSVEKAKAAMLDMRQTDAVYILQREKEVLAHEIPQVWLSYGEKDLKTLSENSQKLIAEYKVIDAKLQHEIKRGGDAWASMYATDAEQKKLEIKKIEQLYTEQLIIHKGKAAEIEAVSLQHKQKLAEIDAKFADKGAHKPKADQTAEIAAERGKYEEILAVAQMADLKGEALVRAKESRDLDRMARERDREIAKHHGSLANQEQYEQAVIARIIQTEREVVQLDATTASKFQVEQLNNQQALLAIEVAGGNSVRQVQQADAAALRAIAQARGTWTLQNEAGYQHSRASLETAAINEQTALKKRAAQGDHDLSVIHSAEKITALRKGGMDEAKLQALINEDKLLAEKSLNQKLTDLEIKRRADIQALVVADAKAKREAESEGQQFTDYLREYDLANAMKHGAAMTAGLAHHSRAMFEGNKALSRANILINGPDAVIQSFRNGGGFPWGLIPAGLMAAEVATQYAATNTDFGGGGSVPSVGSGNMPSIPSPNYSGPSSQNNPPPAPAVAAPGTQQINLTVIGAKDNPDKAIMSYNTMVNEIIPLLNQASANGHAVNINMVSA